MMMQTAVLRSLFFVTTILIYSTVSGGDIKIYDLRCNYAVDPLGIDDLTPSLSWKLTASARGQSQTAYQIIVGFSASPESSPVWNSGKVMSAQSVQIPYGGAALEYGKRYFWKVKVWDGNGIESTFSEVAYWEMTMDPKNWKADWISAPTVFDLDQLNRHRYAMIKGRKYDYLEPLPLLRKQFSVSKKILQARIYIAGPGFHELYLNGQKVSDEVLSPAFTNYDKTVLYNVHDITDLIRPGDNAIGVMLGNGWYNSASKEVWGFDTAPWRNYPTVRLQMEIVYSDGTTSVVVTDPTWKAIRGPIAFSQVRQGEYYDARLEVAKWSEPDIDEKEWKAVRKVAGPIGALRPQSLPPVKVMKVFAPVSSKKLANGNLVYDFGQNIAGYINVKVSGKAGARLEFKYAERTDAAGAADQSNIDNLLADSLFQVDRYTLKGNGEETWSPRFVYHGFRYAELSFSGDVPQKIDVTANAIHTSFEQHGEFSCSNELINKIQQATLWSFRNNFVGFPTDCPQREKNGWTGDAQLACETGLTNFQTVTSYQKWLRDLQDEQQPDGSLPGIVPTSGWGYYWGNGPAWDIACVVIPWSIYIYTGDKEVLRENYDMMKRYVDYMHSRSPQHIADFGLGDWIPVETTTPVGVTSTGYFYYGASVISKAAALIGKEADRKFYTQLGEKIRDAFNEKYFNAKALTYANGSQTALSCALFHGLVPEKHRQSVAKKLVAAVHAKNDHIDTGILGARYIQHVLTDYGQPSLAYQLVSANTYPGWGYWIEQGATTLWEDWRGEASLNHIMLGDVSSWFYKTIGGIRPNENYPGFKMFDIRPEMVGDVTWAKAKYESVYGPVVSEWKIENNVLTHSIEVPVNTTARYYLPADPSGVTEGGKPVHKGGYTISSGKNGTTVILGSGTYQFTMPLPKKR